MWRWEKEERKKLNSTPFIIEIEINNFAHLGKPIVH